MKPEKKMSQEQFDEQLRREFSRADEAQKRVLDKIMSMSEEERRQMAAGVPGPETPEELLGERTPVPRRNVPRRPVRLAFMAASIAICVMSFGMFAVGNKNYEYKVLESGGNVLANNTDVIVVPKGVNQEIMVCASELKIRAIDLGYWPEDFVFKSSTLHKDEGFALIIYEEGKHSVFLQIFNKSFDHSVGSMGESTVVTEVENDNFADPIQIYEIKDDNGIKYYMCYILVDKGFYCIRGCEDLEEFKNIVKNCSVEKW